MRKRLIRIGWAYPWRISWSIYWSVQCIGPLPYIYLAQCSFIFFNARPSFILLCRGKPQEERIIFVTEKIRWKVNILAGFGFTSIVFITECNWTCGYIQDANTHLPYLFTFLPHWLLAACLTQFCSVLVRKQSSAAFTCLLNKYKRHLVLLFCRLFKLISFFFCRND